MSGSSNRGNATFKLYAGPILRRTEPDRVCIWIATSDSLTVRGEVFNAESMRQFLNSDGRNPFLPPILGSSDDTRTISLGKNLHIGLIQIRPKRDPKHPEKQPVFPSAILLGYDLVFMSDKDERSARRLRDVVEIDGPSAITYPPYLFPTFFLTTVTSEGREGDSNEKAAGLLPKVRSANLLHGSCRRLHAPGPDALATADTILAKNVSNSFARPSALILTGDQIYADDVADALIDHIIDFGKDLMGWDEKVPVILPNGTSGKIKTSTLRYGIRGKILAGVFTSDMRANHLVAFAEFAATYLLAWNKENWPEKLPTQSRGNYPKPVSKQELFQLEQIRFTLSAVRRVFANIPTYMIFDDHEVTDDWNLTREWVQKARANPFGRRILANALAAYWVFQGFGNNPDAFTASFIQSLLDSFENEERPGDWETVLLDFHSWAFVSPTNPPVLFLDARTQRGYETASGPPRLLGTEATKWLLQQAKNVLANYETLLIVAPTPVFGVGINEWVQEYLLVPAQGSVWDPESWHINIRGYYDFLRAIHTLSPRACIILSGDVHYAFGIEASFGDGPEGRDATRIIQFCSSALKNMPSGLPIKAGSLEPAEKVVFFWNKAITGPGVRFTEAPSVLAIPERKLINIDQRVDHAAKIKFLKAETRTETKKIVGDNNLGQLLLNGHKATLLFHSITNWGKRQKWVIYVDV